MSIEVKLPHLGDEIQSGDILEVLVREGEHIVLDQGVVEIETDKATVEVPSSAAGVVVKIHVATGQTVRAGDALLTLETSTMASHASAEEKPPKNQTVPTAARKQGDEPSAAREAAAKLDSERASPPRAAKSPSQSASVTSQPQAAASLDSPAATQTERPKPRSSAKTVPAGPAIRRFAREVGVDLALVTGTGRGGRITREDVLEVVRRASKLARRGMAQDSSALPSRTLPGSPSRDSWGDVSLEGLTKMRQTIATKMHESWSTVPRVTNVDDADVTELERIRQTSKADYAAAGIKLTSMPFVIKAVAMALRNHPLINASLDLANNQIVYKHYISIGIAVDTERGLVVPALRNADHLSIADVAKELAALAEKARNKAFTVDDLRGTTFTISNLGAIGGAYSTPIVNVPEVAILLVGRSRKMPVVVEDQIVVRLMMPLSLSYDHRLVDGATAARFLNDVIDYLRAPGRLLLAP